ncbi:hypothetical protein ACIPHM_24560, partial [Pandoraea sp. NPDC087047]
TGVGTAVGAAVGGSSGALTGYNVDRFNRQLHPDEKALAKKVLEDARRRGIVNQDGSPVSIDQIENAMRSANNSTYGETAWTGMVVPLNADTKAKEIYDSTGMHVFVDTSGNKYLVQDAAMLSPPPDALRDLIMASTGGGSSPYSWNVPSSESMGLPSPDLLKNQGNGPFGTGWNTGENSAGILNSDPRNRPIISLQAGFHLPITPGVGLGPNFSYTVNDREMSIKPDVALGTIYDIGANIGISGDSKYSGPSVVNVGFGKYLGIQITPSNSVAWGEKSWISPGRYFNGVSFGIGLGVSSPVNVTVDPTYQYQNGR